MAEGEHIEQGGSPWFHAKKRFLKNYLAVGGAIWLLLNVLVAVFAYPLSPDSSQNANFQLIELAKRPPGTSFSYLAIPIFGDSTLPGPFSRIFFGSKDQVRPLVLSGDGNLAISTDTLFFLDSRGQGQTLMIPSLFYEWDLSHPETQSQISTTGKPYSLSHGQISGFSRRGKIETTLAEMEQRFWKECPRQGKFLLGSDGAGRDVLSRLLLGARVSLSVGFMAVIVSLVIGVFFGAVAGFFRGWVDRVVMWFVSVVWSIPTLLLAISLSFVLGKGYWQLFLAIGVSMWVEVARIVRGQIFSLREMQFVEATRALGFHPARAIYRHILPNILGPIIIISAANFSTAILVEAGLSFLGIGVNPPTPSWGGMVYEGYTQIFFNSGSWLAIYPGLAMVLVVISLNLVGLGLRDAFDPRHELRR